LAARPSIPITSNRRVRHPRKAATLVALTLAFGGCGGSASTPPAPSVGNTLTIYTALPFDGPQDEEMQSIEDGEALALSSRKDGSIIDGHPISAVYVSDGSGSAGGWDTTDTYQAANNATQNLDAIAYIGDFDSAATATSLPVTNADGLLQVSPASPYVGLTDANRYDDKGEPASYYPNSGRTFARLMPSDAQEADATVSFMRSLGVASVYVLTDTDQYNSPFDSVIAPMVAGELHRAGIRLAGSAQIDSGASTTPAAYAATARAIAGSGADAVFVGAAPDAGIEALWQELYRRLPAARLFAPSTLATNPFLHSLGAAGSDTYVTSPMLPLSQYDAAAQRVRRRYEREFKTKPTAWSLYGYEAMSSVLDAIRRAGAHDPALAGNRLDVVKAYFALGWRTSRESVIGRYRISRHGDTSLDRFVGYRVALGGRRLIEIARALGGA
jgi:branched-chain amino acid transport system substrate-binding protein